MKGFDLPEDRHPHETDHRCSHSTDTSNFAYLGNSLEGQSSYVGFLSADMQSSGSVLAAAMTLVGAMALMAGFASRGIPFAFPLG